MALGDPMALADDDAGQDGDHRKYAGGQREQQSRAEKERYDQPEVAVAEQLRDPRVLICRRRGDDGRRGADDLRQIEGVAFFDRRITQALVAASLIRRKHGQRHFYIDRIEREFRLKRIMEYLQHTKIGIVLVSPAGRVTRAIFAVSPAMLKVVLSRYR